MDNEYCNLCPRKCNADRAGIYKNTGSKTGFCGEGMNMRIARAALHFWEEPCISGTKGSGAVFFTGCNLKCVYCQNAAISEGVSGMDCSDDTEKVDQKLSFDMSEGKQGKGTYSDTGKIGSKTGASAFRPGREVSPDELSDIFFRLKGEGANNINLVTPSHFVPQIREAILIAKEHGFDLPFVYNSSAYESVETLKTLEGLIDIYLPDLKYMDAKKAAAYSHAPDYPEVAKAAIAEMFRQVGEPVFAFDAEEDRSLIEKGLIVRHLVLPLGVKNACDVIDYLASTYSDRIYISVMSQYTPLVETPGALTEAQKNRLAAFPELARRVTKREYERVIGHCCDLGLSNVYIQEGEAALDSFIPAWDM